MPSSNSIIVLGAIDKPNEMHCSVFEFYFRSAMYTIIEVSDLLPAESSENHSQRSETVSAVMAPLQS